MKNHFRNLFAPGKRNWTIAYLLAAVLLIAAASLVKIADNPPGIALFYAGILCLFMMFIHPWRKAAYYGILAGICAGIIALIFLGLHIYSSLITQPTLQQKPTGEEGFMEGVIFVTVLFVCAPGIIIGIFGAIFYAIRNR